MPVNYILMNKDSAWLSFSCRRNEFDEVECSEHEWYTELRPWGYHNLTDYLTGRQAPKHRKHITELLERYNCNDLEGFLNVTHALSLNDTFWVKPETSLLKWDDVSLYRNEFFISKTATAGIRSISLIPAVFSYGFILQKFQSGTRLPSRNT